MTRYFSLLSALSFVGLANFGVAAEDSLDEVLVTAQRRSERLQDVPAAISA